MYLDRDKELNMFPMLMEVILNSYDGGIRWLTLKFVEHENNRDGVNYLSIFVAPTSYFLLCDKSFPKVLVQVPIRDTFGGAYQKYLVPVEVT